MHEQKHTAQPADPAHRARARELLDRLGTIRAADELGVGHATLARIVGALPVRSGTRALLRERLGPAKDEAGGASHE